MKILFIPAKVKSKVNKSKILEISKKLPKNIIIAYPVQYQDVAGEINKILSKNHKIIRLTQVLGCSNLNPPKNTQAILLISSGRFHAISIAVETELPVYILEHNSLKKISEQDIESFKKRQRASYLKFLHSDKIGILISTKPGQQNLQQALEIKEDLTGNKKTFFFLSNNIDTKEFENFGLNCWINTACPRLDMNSNSIINMDKIKF
jgi:diphthamide biosynthesis enzyme Dph1/Dph2-like protein